MKKLIVLLLSLMMVFVFTACGNSEPEPEPEGEAPAVASEPEESEEPVTSETSGIVENIKDGELTIYTQAKESLTFNIENAEIDAVNDIDSGDTATVEYTGEIQKGDTTECEVTKVTDETADLINFEGQVKSLDKNKNTLTIVNNDTDYTFDVSAVSGEAAKAANGDTVALKYKGVIKNTDTSHAYVKNLTVTQKKKEKKEVKIKAVNDKVWVTKKTTIRADADSDSEKIVKVKKGTKLKRTGITDNGWSRVVYKDKDRYVKTKHLTTKKPKKKSNEEKNNEESNSNNGESNNNGNSSDNKKKEQTEDPNENEDPTNNGGEKTDPEEEEQPNNDVPEEPETLTDKGVVTAIDKKSMTLDNGKTYDISEAKVDFDIDEAMDKKVKVEYTDAEGPNVATHVYMVDSDKGTGGDSGSGGGTSMPVIIIAIIVVIAAAAALIVRSRRKSS